MEENLKQGLKNYQELCDLRRTLNSKIARAQFNVEDILKKFFGKKIEIEVIENGSSITVFGDLVENDHKFRGPFRELTWDGEDKYSFWLDNRPVGIGLKSHLLTRLSNIKSIKILEE